MKGPVALALLLCLPAGVVAGEAPSDAPPIPYVLDDDAMMEAGCLPPCMCPVLIRSPLGGGMTLTPSGFDGVYQRYDVRGVSWKIPQGTQSALVTGSGTYKVAGDSQQLTLDLAVGSEAPRRYDSGLTGGGSLFPRLRLPVALHGFFCFDSVYGVLASPSVVGVIPPPAPLAGLRVGPNPFRGVTGIGFSLPAPGPVDLVVHDLAGRRVRAVWRGIVLESGPHLTEWDGLDEAGHEAPAGLYFVSLKTPGRQARATLVKL